MTENASRSITRKTIFYAVLIVFVIVISFVAGELSVRIMKLAGGPSTFPFRMFDPELGVALIPGAEGAHRRCYDGYVKINSHGMRDKERTIEKPDGGYRIAVFSDSMLEAVHVKPEETATYILEELLNRQICRGRCEVLNFSVGGYSALQYYLRYLRDGRRFNPDLIVVATTDNDIPLVRPLESDAQKKSSYHSEALTVGNYYPSPYLVESNGAYYIEKPKKPKMANWMLSLFRASDLSYFLYKVYNLHMKSPPRWPLSDAVPDWAKFQPNYVFLDPENPLAASGWQQTKHVLDLFTDQARRDGARFLLVHWGYDVGSNPWYKPLPPGIQLPESFDPQYASKWYTRYARERGVPSYDLSADLISHIRSRGLTEPYLSFSCDMHFNPEGQSVTANLLFDRLKRSNMLPIARQ